MEKNVSIYDPVVDAYRQVPLSLAKKFIERVGEIKEGIKLAEEEQAKEDAYNKSLKKSK